MVNAFGWAARPPPSTVSASTEQAKVLYITLTTVPNLSPSTKARAAFRIKAAQAVTMDSFRDSVDNKQHPLHHVNNGGLIAGFDENVEQMRKTHGVVHRMSMCVLMIDFHSGVRRCEYLKNFFFADNPAHDYSAQWNPTDWLEYLKTEVAKGKEWRRGDVSFF
jgi:hypothetical protein